MNKLIILHIMLFFVIKTTVAQQDSIVFKNGNFLVGKVKSMDRNVLMIETDFSDKDFAIEWNGVKEIYTNTYYLITLTNGVRYNGSLKSVESGKVSIITEEEQTVNVNPDEIVMMDDLERGFWKQVYASVDFGIDLTKANNLKQYSMRSNVGYMARRWQLDLNYNSLKSKQDNVDDIIRVDGGTTYKYFLAHDWYPMISLDFLTNSDQQIDLRSSLKMGLGKYILHTNKLYWGFSIGANYNKENYTPPTISDRNSLEGFAGTELNLFNIGDLSLLSQLIAYPSFTESGRWRSDFKFDAKYDLPLDFYVKMGCTINLDNQPAEGSEKYDYVFHTGFGWEW